MPWDLQIGESRGAVMDERFNGGGAEAEYVVAYLQRRLLSYWAASVQILFWFDIAHVKSGITGMPCTESGNSGVAVTLGRNSSAERSMFPKLNPQAHQVKCSNSCLQSFDGPPHRRCRQHCGHLPGRARQPLSGL